MSMYVLPYNLGNAFYSFSEQIIRSWIHDLDGHEDVDVKCDK